MGIVGLITAGAFMTKERTLAQAVSIWGRGVAGSRTDCVLIIVQAIGRFMPPVFPGARADSLQELATKLGLEPQQLVTQVQRFNAACNARNFDHAVLDGNATTGITPAKTNWALPLDTPPFYGFALRPGITFTYLGLRADDQARVHFGGQPSENLFAAGEMMPATFSGRAIWRIG